MNLSYSEILYESFLEVTIMYRTLLIIGGKEMCTFTVKSNYYIYIMGLTNQTSKEATACISASSTTTLILTKSKLITIRITANFYSRTINCIKYDESNHALKRMCQITLRPNEWKNEWKNDSTAKMEHCAVANSAHIYQTRTHARARAHTHTGEREREIKTVEKS